MSEHDGIALDDSYLFTGLTEAQRDFLSDNEQAILSLITHLASHDQASAYIETLRKDVVALEKSFVEHY